MKALRWALAPLAEAQWVTALATVVLAIFAIFAWRAAQGQLDELRAERDPLMAVIAPGQPSIDESGQVSWPIAYNNVGKSVAYEVVVNSFIKIGDEKFQPSLNPPGADEILGKNGIPQPPGVIMSINVLSRKGISKDYFEALIKDSFKVGVIIEFSYQTTPNGPRTIEDFCYMLYKGGIIGAVPIASCPR